ncbi:MAG: putative lipid II flippase FtsW [Clostridia bacterium]|nr:putative lipid II flippase FtsW [Clostridia bacterium]
MKTQYKSDYIILIVVLLLVTIGLVFVYSASMYNAQVTYNNRYFFLSKQAVGALVGVVALVFCWKIPLERVKKLWVVSVVLSAVLLVLVFVPGIGIENYGANRWIGFGSFSLQPSELAKFSYVLFCAVFMSRRDMKKFGNCLVVIAVGVAFCALIIAEPNMSITMCMAMIMMVMLFVGGARWKHLFLMLFPIVLAVPLLILLEPYRMLRLLAFLDPWASPKGEGYQLIQSLYALGGGGWFGRGLFNSIQKYRFLPFSESDFVFAIIGEETGLVGCLIVFSLYALLVIRGVRIAVNCNNRFCCFLSCGITSVIAVQSLLNFAVVTGSIPPTGLPLPFISYGGTSLVVFMAAVGLLLNISKNISSTNIGGFLWII